MFFACGRRPSRPKNYLTCSSSRSWIYINFSPHSFYPPFSVSLFNLISLSPFQFMCPLCLYRSTRDPGASIGLVYFSVYSNIFALLQCDQKKLPNVFKSCPKNDFTRKMIDFGHLYKNFLRMWEMWSN